MKSRVQVTNGHFAELGSIVQQNMVGKIRFGLESGGSTYGTINAENWRAWNFAVNDHTGAEVARITKTFAGLANAMFTQADHYVVHIHSAARRAAAVARRGRCRLGRHGPQAGRARLQLMKRIGRRLASGGVGPGVAGSSGGR